MIEGTLYTHTYMYTAHPDVSLGGDCVSRVERDHLGGPVRERREPVPVEWNGMETYSHMQYLQVHMDNHPSWIQQWL